MHSHKYMGRSEAFSPPQAMRLTFHLSELCQTCRWHNCKLWEGTKRKREKDKVRMLGETEQTRGLEGGRLKTLPEEQQPKWKPKRAFEDLHVGWLLQCVEHSDNLFKEKQITPEVKEHWGTVVKTFSVSLHCCLASLFEGRFDYNNNPNQSLELLSLGSLVTVGTEKWHDFSGLPLADKGAKWCKHPGAGSWTEWWKTTKPAPKSSANVFKMS